MILDYALRNLEKGHDRRDEIDGWLVLLPGTVKFISHRLDVNKSTVQCTWNRALTSCYLEDSKSFASLSCKFGSGHHQKFNRDDVIPAVKEIPFKKRTVHCKLASALNLPKSTVYSIAKDNQQRDVIRPQTNDVVPKLTDECKIRRFLYFISHLQLNHPEQLHPSPEDAFDPVKFGFYDGFYNQVHVD